MTKKTKRTTTKTQQKKLKGTEGTFSSSRRGIGRTSTSKFKKTK